MCGIAGYFGEESLPEERVRACLSLMRRRGPDHAQAARWTNPAGRKTLLLHSRLSIIDLDPRSNQPFALGSRSIVFNGELYNYLEVRRDLEKKGRAFRTTSDTEVLLAALGEWGDGVLDRCEGMWAFAVYDESEGSLLLSRDRFGEKPLYVHRDVRGLYFGSEAKFIFALLGRRLPINRDHVLRYLVNGYKSLYKEGHTFFRGLAEVPAGTLLRLDRAGSEVPRRYWTPRLDPDDAMTRGDAVAGTRERLIRAVELRLRADVPLAFCMSGGIDSNSLIAIAKRVFGYDVHGFTIANTDARYEEEEMVQCSVRELGIRHTQVPLTSESFLGRLRELVRYHDAPVYTLTYFAHWLLMGQIHAAGYRISVSGTAADELFSGYYDHHLAYLYEIRSDASLLEESRRAWLRHIRPIVRNPFLQDPDAFLKNPGMRDHIFLNADGFSQLLTTPWSEPFRETDYSPSLLRNRMMNELFHEAVPVILHEDDLNAMYFSIENRSPFLDRELFEFAGRIPTRHLIQDAFAKSVLREAMRGIVPDPILDNRRKVGFNAPLLSFLDVGDPRVRSAVLDPSPIFDYLRREAIESLLEKPQLPNSESKFLFYFLSTKLFLEECATGTFCPGEAT
jgi:asparagine synthase (glutamine-hydrolysing)